MQKILITGCSTGFGLDTARHFLEHGWEVTATMRTPSQDILPPSKHLKVIPLDVTNEASIRQAVEAAGPIDALVNNAGVGLMGIFEGTPMTTIRALFETNFFGALAVMQAFLPQFRQRKSGVIVNVSSSTTLRALPLLAAYTASKAAMNAFTESLALELEDFNVRVRLVLPGRSPETAFGQNARAQTSKNGVTIPEPYADWAKNVFGRMGNNSGPVTRSADVSAAIWRAVNDPSCPIRLPAGEDAVALAK